MAGQYELGDLSGVLGGDLYNSLFGSQGFSGYNSDASGGFGGDNPWMTEQGFNEAGNINWGLTPNENAMNAFDNFKFNWNPTGMQAGTLTAFDPSGKQYGKYEQEDEDGFTQLMGMVAPAVAGWGFGGALSGLFGGGMMGTALGQGLTNGTLSAMQGGNFGKGFLGGAIGGGLQGLGAGTPEVWDNLSSEYIAAQPGTSLAGAAGITNPTLAGMFNRGATGALSTLAQGGSGREALTSGLTGAAMSGINSVGKTGMNFLGDSLKSWLGTDPGSGSDGGMDAEFDSLPGNMVSDPMDQSVAPEIYSDEGARFDNSADFSYGFQPSQFLGGESPQQFTQSAGSSEFSLPSIFGNAGSRLGNFALNNAGDLASMLYGFYNNRRQQKALGQQVSSLQSLYSNNSPYAQQLRNTLNARAAATGRRSNIAGRETQLQAQLADRAASLTPTLMQLNQARGSLKNNNMNMLLQGANKLGVFNSLGSLFGPSTSTIPYNNGNVSGSDMFGWKGSGGM